MEIQKERVLTIEPKDYEFLKSLVHQLLTQDRLGTANPVDYIVQSKERYFVPEEHDYEEVEYYDPDDVEATYDSEEAAKEDGVAHPSVVYIKYRWVDREHFLTRQAAEGHLASNRHHYPGGRIYVGHHWRNYEIRELLRIVSALVGEKYEC